MKLIPPKVQAKINPRHKLSSNAIAKAEKFKDCTCAPPEVLAKDIAAYNAGDFTKIQGNILINGREYCLKQEGRTLFPVKGDDFVMLRSNQMRVIKLLKTTPPEKLQDALKGINKNAILITDQDLAFAKEFIAKY